VLVVDEQPTVPGNEVAQDSRASDLWGQVVRTVRVGARGIGETVLPARKEA